MLWIFRGGQTIEIVHSSVSMEDDDDCGGLINTVFDYEGCDSDSDWESNRQDNLDPSAETEQRPPPSHYCTTMHYNVQ